MIKKLKLGVVFSRLSPRDLIRFSPLAELLKKNGGELFCLQISTTPSAYYFGSEYAGDKAGFRVETLFSKSVDQINKYKMKKKLISYLIKENPDIIWSNYSTHFGLCAANWAKKNRKKVIFSCVSKKDDYKRHRIKESLKNLLLSCFDGAFVGGKFSLEYISGLGFPQEKCIIGSNYTDNNLWQHRIRAFKLSKQDTFFNSSGYILYVGRLLELKNLSKLICVYHKLINQGLHVRPLVIVGDGPMKHSLLKYINKYNLFSYIKLVGAIPNEELVAYYVGAAAFILPSISERWGLVVNEAMACGLPVAVSNRCGCWPELVKPHANGWIFDPYNEEEIKKTLSEISLMTDETLYNMGEESKKIIAEYHPNIFASNALRLIKKICASQSKPKIGARLFLRLLTLS